MQSLLTLFINLEYWDLQLSAKLGLATLHYTNFISNLPNMRPHDSVQSAMQHKERQRKNQAKYEVTRLLVIKYEQMVDRNDTASFLNWKIIPLLSFFLTCLKERIYWFISSPKSTSLICFWLFFHMGQFWAIFLTTCSFSTHLWETNCIGKPLSMAVKLFNSHPDVCSPSFNVLSMVWSPHESISIKCGNYSVKQLSKVHCRGGFWERNRGYMPPSPLFSPRKKLRTSKKYSINKIYQINPRLKEMNCLMTIAETKKTFSAI